MASPSSKSSQSQPDSLPIASFLWGIALLATAFLLLLSLVSYNENDIAAVGVGSDAKNWIGAFGATLAYALGPFSLGSIAAYLVPVLIGLWGWTLMRRLDWKQSFQISAWLLALTIWTSTFVSLAHSLWVSSTSVSPLAGQFGYWADQNIAFYLGYTGSLIGMVVLLILGLGISVAGFAGWFETKVNTTIERASQVKLPKVSTPKFSWFSKKQTVENLTEEEEETTSEPLPYGEGISANGKPGKVINDLSQSSSAKKGKTVQPSPSQLQFKIEDRTGYIFPSLDLFEPNKSGQEVGMSLEDQQKNADLLEKSLATFGVQAKVVRVNPGPVITRFDLEPAPGVKVSRIEALADDIMLALRARGLRILAPIPGMAAVGVEMANPKPSIVTFREVVESPQYQSSKSKLTIALGRTVSGEIYVADLASLPHLLIAGTTGAGKSVCVNTIITSILLRTTPEEVQFVMIDPKKIELAAYNELRNHHVTHRPDLSEYVITKPDEAVKALRSCLIEMEHRYDLLAERGARHIKEYNEIILNDPSSGEIQLPYIVVIIDELADLMVTAQREVEEPIARLAQLARAVGIHLVVATQRPSVDVITGVIKANFPARIAFRVAMKVDSRTILDANGAEMLLGQGDMLFQHPDDPAASRIQGAFLTSKEINRVIGHICKQPPPRNKLSLPVDQESGSESNGSSGSIDLDARDPLFMEAAKIVVRTGQGSVSILQRRLKVGYSRAARLIDQLERSGIVGPFDGSKARAVLVDEHFFDNLSEN